MFFLKVVLFAISLGAISVLATPHALHHHALHRRVVAARAASTSSNSSDVSVKRRNSAKCRPPPSSSAPSFSAPSSSVPSPTIPAVTAIANTPQSKPPPATSITPSPSPTSHTQAAPPATSTAPSSGTGGANGPFNGEGTFFATGLGACGITNVATDFIVAVSEIRFDAASTNGDPNDNPLCGKLVTISFGGKTHTATITDRCQACAKNDLDMTTGLFQIFSQLGVGRLENPGIVWSFLD